MTEIQSRLAYISCVRLMEAIKASGICHVLRPPIDQYFTLQFGLFEEILTVGYEYTKSVLADWNKESLLLRLIPGHQPSLNQPLKEPDPLPQTSILTASTSSSVHPCPAFFTSQSVDTSNIVGLECTSKNALKLDSTDSNKLKSISLVAYSYPSQLACTPLEK
ncbi:unnamed protein product, partial [Protopolystoma xenopodis]